MKQFHMTASVTVFGCFLLLLIAFYSYVKALLGVGSKWQNGVPVCTLSTERGYNKWFNLSCHIRAGAQAKETPAGTSAENNAAGGIFGVISPTPSRSRIENHWHRVKFHEANLHSAPCIEFLPVFVLPGPVQVKLIASNAIHSGLNTQHRAGHSRSSNQSRSGDGCYPAGGFLLRLETPCETLPDILYGYYSGLLHELISS